MEAEIRRKAAAVAVFVRMGLRAGLQGVPGGAVLWRVVVTSGGSKGNTYEILPQLATAAAQAVGKNMQADVFVDSDMRVTFGK